MKSSVGSVTSGQGWVGNGLIVYSLRDINGVYSYVRSVWSRLVIKCSMGPNGLLEGTSVAGGLRYGSKAKVST